MVHMYLDFVDQRSSRSKWLKCYPEVALAMSYCGHLDLHISHFTNSQKLCKKWYYVCNFQQPYVHNIEWIGQSNSEDDRSHVRTMF